MYENGILTLTEGFDRDVQDKEGVNLGDADFLHGDSSSIFHFARPRESGIVLMNRIDGSRRPKFVSAAKTAD
jgi:hypothetical protein